MDEDLLDISRDQMLPKLNIPLAGHTSGKIFELETVLADLVAIIDDPLKHLDSVDEPTEYLSSYNTSTVSSQEARALESSMAMKALVPEKLERLIELNGEFATDLHANYVTKTDHETLQKERDDLKQETDELRTQLNALQETMADLPSQLKNAQDSARAELVRVIRNFCDKESGTAFKGQSNLLLTPVSSAESTDRVFERRESSATLDGDPGSPDIINLIPSTRSSEEPMLPLLPQSDHANPQQSLPILHVTDRLAQELTYDVTTTDVLKLSSPARPTTKSTLRADASGAEIQEEIDFVGALLSSLDACDEDVVEKMNEFNAQLKDLQQRLRFVNNKAISAQFTKPDDDDEDIMILEDSSASKPTQTVTKEVDGITQRRNQYEGLVNNLNTSGISNNDAPKLTSAERQRELNLRAVAERERLARGRSGSKRSQSRMSSREEEQDMPASLLNSSSYSNNTAQTTGKARRDRSPSIEYVPPSAPSHRFGKTASGKRLSRVKIESTHSQRGYDEDDTDVTRRSQDDAQGQAKRRRTQFSSLLPALDASADSPYTGLQALRRGNSNSSRTSASSVMPELKPAHNRWRF